MSGFSYRDVMAHPGPSTQATIPLAAHTLSPALPATPVTAPYWQRLAMSGTYLPSNLAAAPEFPSTVPPQPDSQGSSGWHRSRSCGLYSARNDSHTRRISLLSPQSNFIAPSNVGMGHGKWSVKSSTAPMDFFVPKVVHTTATSSEAHTCLGKLETCTTWKGLSFAGAEELSIWTNIYRLLVKQHSQCCRFRIDFSSIAVEMVACYKQGSDTGLSWFFSAPNIHSRVERLLSMSTAAPRLQIEELEIAVVGLPYTLLLRVVGLSDNPMGSFASEIVFSTSEDWLSFDASCNVFSGIVPFAPPRNIIVKAKVIEYLDERVRLEHVIRGSLNIRAKASAHPDMYSILIPEERVIDRQTSAKNRGSRKQVSFTEELETASSQSSPDQLRSFLNDLSALTYDSTHEGNSQESAVTKQLSREPDRMTDARFSHQAAFAEAKVADETGHESSTGDSSQAVTGSIMSSPERQGLLRADSGGHLHAHVRLACSTPDEFVGEMKAPRPPNGKLFLTGRVAELHLRDSALNVQNGCHPKSSKFRDNHNADKHLDLDVTHALSGLGYSVAHDVAESGRSLPLVFPNRSGEISFGCGLDCPTIACQTQTGLELRSQHGDYQGLELTQLQPNFSTTSSNQSGVGVDNCYHYRSPSSKPSWKNTEVIAPSTLGRNLLGPQLVERGNLNNSSAVHIEDDTPELKITNPIRHGRLLHQALLCAAIRRGVSKSWATSLSGERIAVVRELANTVDKAMELYDTFGNQFYNDRQISQRSPADIERLLFSCHISPASFLTFLSLMNVDHTSRMYLHALFIRTQEAWMQNCLAPGAMSTHPFLSLGSRCEREPENSSISAAVKKFPAFGVSPRCREGSGNTQWHFASPRHGDGKEINSEGSSAAMTTTSSFQAPMWIMRVNE